MTALESPDYQIARDRIKGNPVISKMAAGIATVPLAELAHQDGTPRFPFMQHANRAFDTAQAQNADNPGYQPYPADAPRHLGLIAEAVLAERAAIRQAVATTMAAPGTGPESGSLSSQCVEVLWLFLAAADGWFSGSCGVAAGMTAPDFGDLIDQRHAEHGQQTRRRSYRGRGGVGGPLSPDGLMVPEPAPSGSQQRSGRCRW